MNRKILLDVFAADEPMLLLKGAVDALGRRDDFTLIITGKEELIKAELDKYDYDKDRIEILNAEQVIESGERPSDALLSKRDSSLLKGIVRAKQDDVIGIISAGNTGACLAGCAAFLGRLPGIVYPTLAATLPMASDHYLCLLDCGAMVDCTPVQLAQFAVMGSALESAMYGIEAPRVALLNVGVEKGKGDELTKAAYEEIEKLPLNFLGNMEAREVLSGKYDVAVCDGFAGNMVLKGIEGSALFTVNLMVESMKNNLSQERDKIRKITGDVLKQIDLSTLLGGVLLGVKKPVIKAHGNSTDRTIPNVVDQLLALHDGGIIEKTVELLNIINES